MSVNTIRSGIIAALDRKYGYEVWGEQIKQEFEAPCFFVKLVRDGQEKELNRRYRRNSNFDIHYFPDGEDVIAAAHDMAEQLYGLFDLILIGGSYYRGRSMSHEVVDGVLHFFVTYEYMVLKEKDPEIKMQTLKQEGSLK